MRVRLVGKGVDWSLLDVRVNRADVGGVRSRERERERERVRENKEERRNYTYFTQYTCRYMNVGMNFISIFSKFSAIML